jgi:hypothetical protein
LIGWRTRLASVLAWLLVTGFHERTYYPFDGSDLLLRAMLFWALFAELGRVASIDALRAGRSDREARVPAIPVPILALQLLWMYACAALLKLEGPLWRDGTALHYALSAPNSFTREWATPLADVAPFVRAATYGSIAFEALFPMLLLASWHPNDFVHQGDVHPREFAKRAELPGRLEDPLRERPGPQLLGQTVSIPPVALLAAARGDPRDDDLVDVGTQCLVEPGTLDAFSAPQLRRRARRARDAAEPAAPAGDPARRLRSLVHVVCDPSHSVLRADRASLHEPGPRPRVETR